MVCLSILSSCNQKQTTQKIEIITKFGATFEVSEVAFKTKLNQCYKVVFNVGMQLGDSTKVKSLFNTAARYRNIHTKAGVSDRSYKSSFSDSLIGGIKCIEKQLLSKEIRNIKS